MNTMRTVFKYAAVVSIPIYIIFTFISYLHNPLLNPMNNWLSDFGNPILNPSGAMYYNTGCIIAALLLIVFSFGLYRWYHSARSHGRADIPQKYRICFVAAQISGVISNLFLLVAALFPLGTQTEVHSFSAMFHMIGTDCFLAFTATAFLLNPGIKKWIGIYGFLTAFVNIITTNAFTNLFIAEWIYFLMFMIYMVIILSLEEQLSLQQTHQNNKNGVKYEL